MTKFKIPKMIPDTRDPNAITTVNHCASDIPSHPLSEGDEPTALMLIQLYMLYFTIEQL